MTPNQGQRMDRTAAQPALEDLRRALRLLKDYLCCSSCRKLHFPIYRCASCWRVSCDACRFCGCQCVGQDERNSWRMDQRLSRIIARFGGTCSTCGLCHEGDFVCAEEEKMCPACALSYSSINEDFHKSYCDAFAREIRDRGAPPSPARREAGLPTPSFIPHYARSCRNNTSSRLSSPAPFVRSWPGMSIAAQHAWASFAQPASEASVHAWQATTLVQTYHVHCAGRTTTR